MVIIISEFGIKIKNISAGTLYDVNLGTRDYFSYTEAMLNNSLFSAFLIKNGLNVYKGESTRDIICLDFDFGTRSYEDEHKRIEQLRITKLSMMKKNVSRSEINSITKV